MTCPDEATFLRLQDNTLPEAERRALHAHLDVCPRCLELASLLDDDRASLVVPSPLEAPRTGDTFAPSALTQASMGRRDRDRKLRLLAQLLLLLAHGVWWWVTARLNAPGWPAAFSVYCMIWGPLGAMVALLGWLLSVRGSRTGVALTAIHACVSLPTVVLAPLACTALIGLWRNRRATVG